MSAGSEDDSLAYLGSRISSLGKYHKRVFLLLSTPRFATGITLHTMFMLTI